MNWMNSSRGIAAGLSAVARKGAGKLRAGLSGAVAGAALALFATSAAVAYPEKPIRLIVGFPPGGGADIIARAIGPELGKSLGQTVVVDNRAGANGIIATQALASAPADGYTLMLTISSHVTNALLYPKAPYDTLKDFAPVSLVATSPFILVANPSLPANNVTELVALAKAKPGSINYGSPGNGSTQHLFHELMNLSAGVTMTHVAYKGGAPMLTDLLAGYVTLGYTTPLFSQGYLKQNKLKALAVSSRQRTAMLPNVPTVGESIPGYEAEVWYGVIAPAAAPKPIVAKLAAEMARIVRSPAMMEQLTTQAAEPVGSTPEQFAATIESEHQKWSAVIKKTGIKAE
jgi:tripartite-type tricarboxylate transporter receptor subunit TctC